MMDDNSPYYPLCTYQKHILRNFWDNTITFHLWNWLYLTDLFVFFYNNCYRVTVLCCIQYWFWVWSAIIIKPKNMSMTWIGGNMIFRFISRNVRDAILLSSFSINFIQSMSDTCFLPPSRDMFPGSLK